MITCRVCPRMCELEDGQAGFCKTRGAYKGRVISLQGDHVSAVCFDPTNKKNLYHWHPGKTVLSIGGFGCNLDCYYCQNHAISQAGFEPSRARRLSPIDAIALAKSREDCVGVAVGYNEPAVNYEYVQDIGHKLADTDLHLVIGTNGFVSVEYRQLLLAYANAVVVSFRGYSSATCKKVAGHAAAHTQAYGMALQCHQVGVHCEVSYIVIPGINDGQEFDRFARAIARQDPTTPVHLLGYIPYNRGGGLQATHEQLVGVKDRARAAGLVNVYAANCQQDTTLHSTYCACGKVVILRDDVSTLETHLDGTRCADCGVEIAPLII